MSNSITATYSAEDNKLRLYCSERLDEDLYQRVREAGFRWAPKQALFVAPKWTPGREDLCIELAGAITAEEMTLVERAELKAERLDGLAVKRAHESNAYHKAADQIAERFSGGQPILVGHHSERKARRDQAKMHAAMDRAVKAQDAVHYWNWKAEGVERHANRKANPAVRARRIKTLLAELRDRQRAINHAHICLNLWGKINDEADGEDFDKLVRHYAGAYLKSGAAAPDCRGDSYYDLLGKGEITSREVVQICLDFHAYQATSPYTLRWINHILNRLAFERSELGAVPRFEGEITPVILQAFARDNGADKPKAQATDTGFVLTSSVPLPLPIGEGKALSLSTEAWRDLMQAVGYSVPEKKARAVSTVKRAPLINPSPDEARRLQAIWNREAQERRGHLIHGGMVLREVTAIGQAQYSANSTGSYLPFCVIEIGASGNKVHRRYKGPSEPAVCRLRVYTGGGGSLYAPDSIVTLTDKPAKSLPIEWPADQPEQVA